MRIVPVFDLISRPVGHLLGDGGPLLAILLDKQEETLVFSIVPTLLTPGRHLLMPVLMALLGSAIGELLGYRNPADRFGVVLLILIDKLL